jgi:adenine-specific DNA glycosylase
MDTTPADPHPLPPAVTDAVLAWYDATGRELAFRATTDPYAVLVSERMAQQTQADRAGGIGREIDGRARLVEAASR